MKILLTTLLFLILSVANGQSRIAFYNAENLFHPSDDSLTLDEAFTPAGDYRHTYLRYSEKLNHLSKSIISISENAPLLFLGLCEVENRTVLFDLLNETALNLEPYRFIHRDSPDRRGIDVALIYNDDRFTPIKQHFYPICNDSDTLVSREILYCYGLIDGQTPIHIFVNHWPSKYGGVAQSEPKRMMAAEVLLKAVDSIQLTSPEAMIIAMGDFNAEKDETSIEQLIQDSATKLMLLPNDWPAGGTHKFQGHWSTIDHFFISPRVQSMLVRPNTSIHRPDFLLEEEGRFPGYRPYRFYLGPKYHGGYSDHLPVYLDLQF